jgi:branched-chain amino acid transport system permease protein
MKTVGAVVAAFLLSAPWLLPKFVAEFWVGILAEMLIWGLLASSANLLLGYTGLLSFGQSLYFGFGAYGVAFGITRFGLGVLPSFFLAVGIAPHAPALAG